MEDKWIARCILLFFLLIFFYFLYRHKTKRLNNKFVGIGDFKLGSTPIIDLIKPHFKSKHKRINKTEEKCRRIIQKIYGTPFPSIRPDFLKSPRTHRNLELDCYNANLGIALEYNGKQHYTYCPHFHKSKKDFYSQVHRDDWKRKKCREMGIKLIEIPYWIEEHKLEEYITNELRKNQCL